jgi:Tol biopolymer transport system component
VSTYRSRCGWPSARRSRRTRLTATRRCAIWWWICGGRHGSRMRCQPSRCTLCTHPPSCGDDSRCSRWWEPRWGRFSSICLCGAVGEEENSGQWSFSQLTDQPGQELYPSLSPDGRSLVYASQASGNWDIYFQRVGGKTALNLTKDSAADDTQPAFSPDERIVFRSERDGGGLFVMGATGESATRLSDQGFHPSWSPDGKEIAASTVGFANPESLSGRNSQLIVVEVATGKTRVISAAQDVHQPHWSPHGYRVAYWGRPGEAGQRDLWTVAPSGGAAVPVTNDAPTDWNPVWSPDGRSLFFSSNRGGSMNLWRVGVDEASGTVLGQPEPVTTPSPYSGYVSVSRDGRRIAYAQVTSAVNLFKVGFDPSREATAGQPTAITHGTRPTHFPDLSPDGDWIAGMIGMGEAQEDVVVVRTDGTGFRKLTDDPHRDREPRWSPDGKTIAFYSDRSGTFQIWTINADASGLQQLTHADITMSNVVWSPEGTRMAVRSPQRGQMSARVVVLDARKPWNQQTPEPVPFSLSGGVAFAPNSWSADGRKLALTAFGPDPFAGTYIYDFESRQVGKVSGLAEANLGARWLSDNRRLLVGYQGRLYLIDSVSGKIHDVLSVLPDDILGYSLSRDDRLIVYGLRSNKADIWLATPENRTPKRQQ